MNYAKLFLSSAIASTIVVGVALACEERPQSIDPEQVSYDASAGDVIDLTPLFENLTLNSEKDLLGVLDSYEIARSNLPSHESLVFGYRTTKASKAIPIVYINPVDEQPIIRFKLDLDMAAISMLSYQRNGPKELHGDSRSNILFGNYVSDTIFGRDGNDFIDGQNGRDKIFGGPGNDVIYGGRGIDMLHGEEGADIFVLKYEVKYNADRGGQSQPDHILDYRIQDGDLLDLTHLTNTVDNVIAETIFVGQGNGTKAIRNVGVDLNGDGDIDDLGEHIAIVYSHLLRYARRFDFDASVNVIVGDNKIYSIDGDEKIRIYPQTLIPEEIENLSAEQEPVNENLISGIGYYVDVGELLDQISLNSEN